MLWTLLWLRKKISMCKIENAAGGAKLHHPPKIGLKSNSLSNKENTSKTAMNSSGDGIDKDLNQPSNKENHSKTALKVCHKTTLHNENSIPLPNIFQALCEDKEVSEWLRNFNEYDDSNASMSIETDSQHRPCTPQANPTRASPPPKRKQRNNVRKTVTILGNSMIEDVKQWDIKECTPEYKVFV